MREKKYLQVVAISAASLTVLYILLFLFQLGAPMPAEYWVREVKIAKQHLARRVSVPKIVILGGSNGLFGIDSRLIERDTQVKTVNMSLHGALTLDYLLNYAMPVLNKRDTLILALEYNYYFHGNKEGACFTSWYANNLMTWDTQYFMEMPLADKVCLMLSADPKRILNGVLAQYYSARLLDRFGKRRLLIDHEVINKMEKLAGERERQSVALEYGLATMNEYGDFRVNAPSTYFEVPDYGFESRRIFAQRSSKWRTFKYLAEYCRDHGVRLMIAWPPTIDGARTGVQSSLARQKLSVIRHELEGLGIQILGSPEDFSFNREYFLDTNYHLTATGGTLRTEKLVSLLKPLLENAAQRGQQAAGQRAPK